MTDQINMLPEDMSDRVELLIRLLKFSSLINRPMKDGVCVPSGVTSTELKILMVLKGEGPLAGFELTTLAGMAAMNVSRSIASLKQRGWIEDADSSANRRRKPIRLTEAGLAAYANILPFLDRVARNLLAPVRSSRMTALANGIDGINARIVRWDPSCQS